VLFGLEFKRRLVIAGALLMGQCELSMAERAAGRIFRCISMFAFWPHIVRSYVSRRALLRFVPVAAGPPECEAKVMASVISAAAQDTVARLSARSGGVVVRSSARLRSLPTRCTAHDNDDPAKPRPNREQLLDARVSDAYRWFGYLPSRTASAAVCRRRPLSASDRSRVLISVAEAVV
jgi:hypothetical protein